MGDQFGKVYNFYQSSYTVFYENIDRVFDMVEQTYRHHGGTHEDIMTLQKHCVHHAKWPLDVILESSYDLDSWQAQPTQYRVEPRIKHFTGSYDDFARNRRNVLWKNRLVAVER
jgi:hypothetical protein